MKPINSIHWSKGNFNKFFQEDLYGRFDSDSNIILSRGSWEDNHVVYPKLFSFCLNYSLDKHWAGYSDSLGHNNSFEAICKFANLYFNDSRYYYKNDNVAITMGNVFALNQIFCHLKTLIPKAELIALKPFYPSILKSASRNFKKVKFISSLDTEDEILLNIAAKLESKSSKILLLTNAIGVEGRIFSEIFWQGVLKIINNRDVYLIIDEGMWFEPLKYPQEINNSNVIRVVSFSKKFGIPGMKLGFMLASKEYLSKYYDWASSNYGGPPSIFFLLIEFICFFEYIQHSSTDQTKELIFLSERYGIELEKLAELYYDFVDSTKQNQYKLGSNQKTLRKWLDENKTYIEAAYDFGGINVLILPKIAGSSYNLFLSLIKNGASIFPGACIGDDTDSLFRVTLLESQENFCLGLKLLGKTLNEYK
jgi:aspartate/methionine/tyrosine aminotransferase